MHHCQLILFWQFYLWKRQEVSQEEMPCFHKVMQNRHQKRLKSLVYFFIRMDTQACHSCKLNHHLKVHLIKLWRALCTSVFNWKRKETKKYKYKDKKNMNSNASNMNMKHYHIQLTKWSEWQYTWYAAMELFLPPPGGSVTLAVHMSINYTEIYIITQ